MTVTNRNPRMTRQTIWAAMVDMRSQSQCITRVTLAEATGFKMSVLDDHISRMVDDGLLRRCGPGIVEIIEQYPEPRSISITDTPDGWTIIEVGDEIIKVHPQERRALAKRMAGDVVQYSNIELGREMGTALAQVQAALNREVTARKALEEQVRELQGEGAPA